MFQVEIRAEFCFSVELHPWLFSSSISVTEERFVCAIDRSCSFSSRSTLRRLLALDRPWFSSKSFLFVGGFIRRVWYVRVQKRICKIVTSFSTFWGYIWSNLIRFDSNTTSYQIGSNDKPNIPVLDGEIFRLELHLVYSAQGIHLVKLLKIGSIILQKMFPRESQVTRLSIFRLSVLGVNSIAF